MLLLYLASTIYHALPAGNAKRVFLLVDHSAIFLLIAGTYTPFTLGVLRGSWGWSLFGMVWSLALFGIVLKATVGARYRGLSTSLYLAMGWLVLVAAQPVLNSVPVPGLWWLLAGGLAYTVGVAFFLVNGRVRFAHAVWHLFVVAILLPLRGRVLVCSLLTTRRIRRQYGVMLEGDSNVIKAKRMACWRCLLRGSRAPRCLWDKNTKSRSSRRIPATLTKWVPFNPVSMRNFFLS